ncbi:DUF4157 domain-containing protein [Streptomyces sp. NPDC004539]|uniref:eCIS core domain-containing protein n=1 Tax=Streptomyces sp. NPDC004539 TaxID=3154280 RepID=UPI0033B04CDF
MRRSTESRRTGGTRREQDESRGPASGGYGKPLRAGAPGELQRTVGNAAVARMIARERTGGSGEAGADAVREAARTAGRGGRRLPDGMRANLESAFGTDLGHVRVSVDERAAASIDARAYTVGDNIVVQNAAVLRDTETMAHEIHHTTQRGAPGGLSDPDGRWEREASDVGARVARGESVHVDGAAHGGGGDAVQRRVGFEFESQWRVRDHNNLTAQDEQNYQDEVSSRNDIIGAQVLLRMADLRQNSSLLTAAERAGNSEQLRNSWLTPVPGQAGRFQATAAGQARLAQARQASPEQYRQHVDDVTPSLLHNGRIRETPIRGRDVPKMGTVGSGTDYRLTSDVSPTGGAALEWVTDPLTTRDDVLRVMTEITQVSAALDARQGRESFPLDEVNLGGFTANPGMMVFPLDGVLVYAPQMTGGFKLDELPRLIEYLQVPAKRPLLSTPGAFGGRKQARQDLHVNSLGTVDGIRRAAEAQAGRLPAEVTGGESTDALVGLTTLIGSYLRYGSEMGDKANSKSIAGGLMSRTSFAHNFTLLPRPTRIYYRDNPEAFAEFVLRAAGLDPNDQQSLVYPNTVEHGDAGNRAERRIPLTRHQWLTGMPKGRDLLRNYRHLDEAEKIETNHNQADWSHIHGSLGALGTVDDQVGAPGHQEVALVAELRRMKDGLLTADLLPLSVAAFDLVQRLNEGRKLKYEKG